MQSGFPLGFDKNYPLECDMCNHSAVIKYPGDVGAFLQKELGHLML